MGHIIRTANNKDCYSTLHNLFTLLLLVLPTYLCYVHSAYLSIILLLKMLLLTQNNANIVMVVQLNNSKLSKIISVSIHETFHIFYSTQHIFYDHYFSCLMLYLNQTIPTANPLDILFIMRTQYFVYVSYIPAITNNKNLIEMMFLRTLSLIKLIWPT